MSDHKLFTHDYISYMFAICLYIYIYIYILYIYVYIYIYILTLYSYSNFIVCSVSHFISAIGTSEKSR